MAAKKVKGEKLAWGSFTAGSDDIMNRLPSAPDPNREQRPGGGRGGGRGDRPDRPRRGGYVFASTYLRKEFYF
jgi:hypothetical protein